jgi:penicillin-binding protein 1B
MAKSLNVATIKVAEMVGYGTVVNLAHKAGISEDVKATPAMAIGSYVATPLEMAGAYTIFANNGVRAQPTFLSLVKGPGGKVLLDQKPQTKPVLDPRVTYLMVSMLEEVMRTGTAAGVRSRGFVAPAGGKTGTSDHDGWFAGFTSDLLCVVWVGFDDNRELHIEGAHSALPIWTEFMKRALKIRRYSDAKPFSEPDGVVTINIDPQSGMLATPGCPESQPEVFIAGTEPVSACTLHGGHRGQDSVSGWEPPPNTTQVAPARPYDPNLVPRRPGNPPPGNTTPPAVSSGPPPPVTYQNQNPPPEQQKKKKGFFGRLKDVFK